MASFLDVCRFNPTAGGTTDWTVSSAVTGYQTPASAGAVNGAVYRYRAESADLSQWEVGYGAYTVSGTVLARTTVLFSSAVSNAKVSFSAAPQVAIVALAEDLQPVISSITSSLSADVTVSTSTYTDGPSVAQGSSGTWLVSGTVTFVGTASSIIFAKLWDGATTIASTGYNQQPTASRQTLSLSGVITNPAGNLRISAIEQNGQTTAFKFNATNLGKDCTITAVRIG